MKTVEDAVQQEGGVWAEDGFNAMAWLYGDINYLRLDDNGFLHYTEIGESDDRADEDWKLICTREEFEAKAKEMGYVVDESDGDAVDCFDEKSDNQESVIATQEKLTTEHSTTLLLAYLQGQADAGIESAQMALDFYRDLNNKGV